MNVTLEEFNKILTINTAIKDQLAVEEEKAFKMEENLKVRGHLSSINLFLTPRYRSCSRVGAAVDCELELGS